MNKDKTKPTSILDVFVQSAGLLSVAVVILGFLAATILLLAMGRNPLGMYTAMVQTVTGYDINHSVYNVRYVGEWFNSSLPLILCGLSMGFAARSGLFNIGAEGQYMMGLLAAQVFALIGPQSPLQWVIALILAALAGAFWGGIVGWLKGRYAVSEVVATIMLNYIAYYLTRYFVSLVPGTNTYRTLEYPDSALLTNTWLQELTHKSQLNTGIFVVIICIVIYWFIMEKTTIGLGLRATGFNKDAARAAGMPIVKNMVTAMAIAGAFAGLAGAIVALGSFSYGRVLSGFDNYGFTGIAVALVGNSTAAGISLAGLLFGMLASASPLMQSRQIPKEITQIILGLVVLFIALRAGLAIFIAWRAKRTIQLKANTAKGE